MTRRVAVLVRSAPGRGWHDRRRAAASL